MNRPKAEKSIFGNLYRLIDCVFFQYYHQFYFHLEKNPISYLSHISVLFSTKSRVWHQWCRIIVRMFWIFDQKIEVGYFRFISFLKLKFGSYYFHPILKCEN